jgi:6-pyruvoyltetrahydropterin/6-carboxytetrahydropterin synthase
MNSGIVFDFKDLKSIIKGNVIDILDHKLILSEAYLKEKNINSEGALLIFAVEPTAENLLIFIRNQITNSLPTHIQLQNLKLWETRDSYAEWVT